MAKNMMMRMVLLLGVMILGHSIGMEEKMFFESVDDLARIQRNLLQIEEGSGGEGKVEEVTTTTTTEEPLDLSDKAGPEVLFPGGQVAQVHDGGEGGDHGQHVRHRGQQDG